MTTPDQIKLLESLHPLEHKLLLSFERGGTLSASEIVNISGLDESRLDMAAGWLQTKGMLEVTGETGTSSVALTEAGAEYREKGTPEMGSVDFSTQPGNQQSVIQANFRKRGKAKGIFRITDKKNRTYSLTNAGKELFRLIRERGAVLEEASALTPEMLKQ